MGSNNKLRVNLGSGTDYLKGWVNVDVDTTQKVDLIADLSAPFPFKSHSIDELKASDILEHFTKEDGERFLKECHRVLKPGGTIFLRTHNPYQIIKQFGHDPEVMFHFLYGNTSGTGIFGAHKYAYTEKMLRKVAGLIGFTIESFEKETTNFVVILRKMKNTQKSALNVISFGNEKRNYVLSLLDDKNIPITHSFYPVTFSFTDTISQLLSFIFRLPYILFTYSRYLDKLHSEKVGVLVLDGFSEKIVVSWIAKIKGMPVIWVEEKNATQDFHKFYNLPKILYRLAKEIPEYVFVSDEHAKQNLMREGRVSLAKLVVIQSSVTKEQLASLFISSSYSYEH